MNAVQVTLIILQVLHVLSGVFWAGSTFALARMSGNQSGQLFRPQMGAASLAILTGGLLWFLLHRGSEDFRSMFSASALSSPFSPPASKALAARGTAPLPRDASDRRGVDRHAILDQRLAAACLVVTVTCIGVVPLHLRAAALGRLQGKSLW